MTLEKCCKTLLIKEPFYGLFLLGLNKSYSTICETACVCCNGINTELHVNKEFWETLTDEEQIACIKHELGHILFKHVLNPFGFTNHELANIAFDCEVNSYIAEFQKDPYAYPLRFELENAKGSKYYYNELSNLSPQSQSKGKAGTSGSSNSSSQNQSSDDDQNGSQQSGGSGKDKKIVDPNESHGHWVGFDKLSEAEKELVNNQIDYQAKRTAEQVSKLAGKIPGEFQEYIDKLFEKKPAIFNWKAYFRRMLGTIRDVEVKKTRKKESNRFPEASGLRYKKKASIFLVVDTSGSVSNNDLCDFFSEINHIWKAGTHVTICECDSKIQRVYEYTGKWDGTVNGRGGTIMHDAIEMFNQRRRDYQSIIFFTDGYVEYDLIRIMGNAIWVITSNGDKTREYPGKTLFIPKQ